MKSQRLIDSFRNAISGLLVVARTHKSMHIYFLAILFVLFLGLLFKLSRWEMVALFFAIALVLFAEIVDTALESLGDLYSQGYHPLIKTVKDISSAAVLIAVVNSVAVGLVIFLDKGKIKYLLQREMYSSDGEGVVVRVLIGILAVVVLSLMSKGITTRGTALKGGIISLHSALGFFLATSVFFITTTSLARVLSVVLGLLICESRLESGIHTFREVVIGALLGILIGIMIFKLLP